jgi:hypothetical protein
MEERKEEKGKRQKGRKIVQELYLEQAIKCTFSTVF